LVFISKAVLIDIDEPGEAADGVWFIGFAIAVFIPTPARLWGGRCAFTGTQPLTGATASPAAGAGIVGEDALGRECLLDRLWTAGALSALCWDAVFGDCTFDVGYGFTGVAFWASEVTVGPTEASLEALDDTGRTVGPAGTVAVLRAGITQMAVNRYAELLA
jgi:hypothetical protein